MFKEASRMKLRFDYKGQASVEDLWNIPLSELDTLYSKYKKELSEMSHDSLLARPTTKNAELNLKIKILVDVVTTRLAEQEEKLRRAANKEKKQKLLRIISEKEDAGLKEMSVEDLKKMAEEL